MAGYNTNWFEVMRKKEQRKKNVKKYSFVTARQIVSVLVVLVVMIPICAILIASFKSHDSFQSTGAFQISGGFTLDNYKEALIDGNLIRAFVNTMIISGISIAVTIFMGSMTAYVLSRFRFIGSRLISTMFLVASFMPGITMQISIFHIIKAMNIYNTFLAVILIYAGTDVVSVYIFLQQLKEIPKSIDEAALMDGATYFTVYRKIILPLLKPSIIMVVILKGIAFYNDFFTAYLYLPFSDHAVISTALYRFNSKFGGRLEVLAAGIIITMIPTLIAFILFRKQIYDGIEKQGNNK